MRSLNRVGAQPVSLPLAADDIVEFHAARLLLLMDICGVKGNINGLTKMAKLDFFSRYPDFFEVARAAVTPSQSIAEDARNKDPVESAMVRHHYGPWDKRYYHGGTDTLYFLMAYHYGLLTLSPDRQTHYPGFAIIDVPGEFSGEAVEDKENFIVQPFIDLLQTEAFEGAQLIMTGSSFTGLQGAHFQRLADVHVA